MNKAKLKRGRRSWTTKSRKTEKEMDRRRQLQHGGIVAHGGGHGIVPNGEGEPVWLTPHQRDSQPEGEREKKRLFVVISQSNLHSCVVRW